MKKVISLLLSFCLMLNYSAFAKIDGPQAATLGHNSHKAAAFRPLHLRYISYDQLKNMFNIILDKGNFDKASTQELQDGAKPLLNYFFIGVNLPSEAFWVNLRPDSADKIIDSSLEKTDIGRILLEADLQLKKDIAQATSPQVPAGKEYWDKLYKKIDALFGKADVSIPTLTRPWIVPGEVVVRETADSAYIYKATLKIMLESDYLKGSQAYDFKDKRLKELNEYSTQLIKELVLPRLNKEVNSSERYAALRQVYYSLILSQWFKARFKGQSGPYAALIDKKDLTGMVSAKPWKKGAYFEEYQKSFSEKEYNLKESVNALYGRSVKSYYSGGVDVGLALAKMYEPLTPRYTRADVEAGLVTPDYVGLLRGSTPVQLAPQMPAAPGAQAPTGPGLNYLPAPGAQFVPTLGVFTAPRVVIPAADLTRLASQHSLLDKGASLEVRGRPGVDLQIIPASERPLVLVQEGRATRIQQITNRAEMYIHARIEQDLPQLAVPVNAEAPQRAAVLEQALAAPTPDVYRRRDVAFVRVEGLSQDTQAYGAPEAVHIDLTGYGRPVVFIDKQFAGNRIVEGYALEKIARLRTEIAAGRVEGVTSLADIGTFMRQRPQEATRVLARVHRQAIQRFDVGQVIPAPAAHFPYGVTQLSDATKGLSEMDTSLAVALEQPGRPEHMDRITEIGNRALLAVQRDSKSPARQVLVGILSHPLSQEALSLGTPERVLQSPLAVGRALNYDRAPVTELQAQRGRQQVAAFADFLFQARDTLAAVPDVTSAEKQVLSPRPVVDTTLAAAQAPLVISPDRWESPAMGQVNAAVRVPGLVDGRVSVQVQPRPEGIRATVSTNRGDFPVLLEPERPVFVAVEQVRPAAPVRPGTVIPEAGRPATETLRLVVSRQDLPSAPAPVGPALNYERAPGAVALAPALERLPLMRVKLARDGTVTLTNVARPEMPARPELQGATIAVTAFPSRIAVADLMQAPALPTAVPSSVGTVGGIDLRVLPIVTEPLSNLSANLNKSTLRTLRDLDLEKEWGEIEKMIQAGMIPSAERIKENIQASCLQGEINLDMDRIVLDISRILQLEESRSVATEPVLRDILIVFGAAASPLEISQVFLGKT